jgi:hypothetical protein
MEKIKSKPENKQENELKQFNKHIKKNVSIIKYIKSRMEKLKIVPNQLLEGL